MYITAQIFGVLAVITFALSYQAKSRKGIALANTVSNVFYVLQYVFLGAFDGAAVDALSALSGFAAYNKDKRFMKKHMCVVIAVLNIAIFVSGMLLYRNVFSLCSVAGAVLQVSALWISDEKKLRLVSFPGAALWLAYNLANGAYGSVVGNLLCMISIGIAMCRYDIGKTKKSGGYYESKSN